jgi:hypothetical protein
MRDFVGDRECVTHHACDCIQGKADRLDTARALVLDQAENDGLWFLTESITEAYLQQELRRLHAAVEGTHLQAKSQYHQDLGLGEDNKP